MAVHNAGNNAESNTADREIVANRVFDAPRDVVFRMWTDPEHIRHWWGPRGFRNTIHEMEVRPGGVWRFIMHGPDGTDYQNKIVYTAVAPPEHLAYSHVSGPLFDVTVDFIDRGAQTEIRMRMVFETASLREQVVKQFGAVEGLQQTLSRLDERLEAMSAQPEFVLSREFVAPRDVLFKVWTDPAHLAHWWGPTGFTLRVASLDLRPGGVFHYGMEAPNGQMMWGRFVYREVVSPERLVFINSFSDEQGHITRHPLSATWPLEVLTTVTLVEHNGRTTLTLRGGPVRASDIERRTFEEGTRSMQQGFGGTFDQLESYLARLS